MYDCCKTVNRAKKFLKVAVLKVCTLSGTTESVLVLVLCENFFIQPPLVWLKIEGSLHFNSLSNSVGFGWGKDYESCFMK